MRIITCRVHPRSRRREVRETGPGEYAVSVCSPPEKGEANREVVEVLAEHFGLPPSQVVILRGKTGRKKIVSLEGSGIQERQGSKRDKK